MSKRRYEANLATVVDRLRRLADEVEREGVRTLTFRGEAELSGERAVINSAQVVHAVSWGVANLNLDSLVLSANDWRSDDERNRTNG